MDADTIGSNPRAHEPAAAAAPLPRLPETPLLNPLRAAALVALLSVAACSPTFNWREWPVPGTPLRALMPCKPESASRPVPMADAPVDLHMHACETGGMRFAVAWADVGRADQVPAALAAWPLASLRTLQVTAASPDDPGLAWAVEIKGASQVRGLRVQGTDHRGQPVQTQAVYFARGSQVFQAAVYGARMDQGANEAFFAGLDLAAP